jgi:hypothetical protein
VKIVTYNTDFKKAIPESMFQLTDNSSTLLKEFQQVSGSRLCSVKQVSESRFKELVTIYVRRT